MGDGIDSSSQSHHLSSVSNRLSSLVNQETLQLRLQTLIDGAREYWIYAVFWQLSTHSSHLEWGDGYYRGEKDKERLSCSSVAEQEHRKKVFRQLISLIDGPQGSADDEFDEEVSDSDWFFLISMAQSFVNGSGLPGRALYNASCVWVSGAERLASSHCERARQAQALGIQTIVCIPLEDGVIELGSSALIFPRSEFDMLDRIRPLFNFRYNICIQEIGTESAGKGSIPPSIQPGYESESSVGNCPMFQRGDSSSRRDKKRKSNSGSDSDSRYLEVFTQILRRAKR